jgi:hypothetical protein
LLCRGGCRAMGREVGQEAVRTWLRYADGLTFLEQRPRTRNRVTRALRGCLTPSWPSHRQQHEGCYDMHAEAPHDCAPKPLRLAITAYVLGSSAPCLQMTGLQAGGRNRGRWATTSSRRRSPAGIESPRGHSYLLTRLLDVTAAALILQSNSDHYCLLTVSPGFPSTPPLQSRLDARRLARPQAGASSSA